MTMKRNAKAEITTAYRARYTGEIREATPGPRLYAIHGRYLPGPVAARLFLSVERVTKTDTRETWTARQRHPRLTSAVLLGGYTGRRRAA